MGYFDKVELAEALPYEADMTVNGAIEKAQVQGLLIRFPKATELFVDIDNAEDFGVFSKQYERLKDAGLVEGFTRTSSKSGGEREHVVVTLKSAIGPVERLLLQAVLGSDRVRELLGYLRTKAGNPFPTLFFEALTK